MNEHAHSDLTDRDLRQRDIIPPEQLAVFGPSIVTGQRRRDDQGNTKPFLIR